MAASRCETDAGYRALDFWVGNWEVFEGTTKSGENSIVKILNGCAIVENWKDVQNNQGKSFFYLLPVAGHWKQVWVQDDGFVKEKEVVSDVIENGIRFQGLMKLKNGTHYLDRTTLIKINADRVRQLIEVSSDEGKTWRATFDAVYVRNNKIAIPMM